jgi:hypothetical protein
VAKPDRLIVMSALPAVSRICEAAALATVPVE